jgi:lycopene cyclase domain-containing protein
VGSFPKDSLLEQKRFWLFLGITLGLTLIFNGYLTWRPVVIYNLKLKTNLLIWTVPMEDFIYGLILNGAFVWVYEKFQKEA